MVSGQNDCEDGAAASSSGREKQVIFATKNVAFCLKKPDFDVKTGEFQALPETWKRRCE